MYHSWPNSIDALVSLSLLGLVMSVITFGYVAAYLDFRRWLKSLTRTLVCVVRYFPHMPEWAMRDTPRCLAALGLRLPCSETELLIAYRERVKVLHPDHGGDKRLFLRLQQHFEQALEVVRESNAAAQS